MFKIGVSAEPFVYAHRVFLRPVGLSMVSSRIYAVNAQNGRLRVNSTKMNGVRTACQDGAKYVKLMLHRSSTESGWLCGIEYT